MGYPGSVGLMQSIPPSVEKPKEGLSNALTLCFLCEIFSPLSRFTPSRAEAEAYMKNRRYGLSPNLRLIGGKTAPRLLRRMKRFKNITLRRLHGRGASREPKSHTDLPEA